MKCHARAAALLAVLALVLPALAADKKGDKKDEASANDATAKGYQALAEAHTATGKLISVGASDKSLGLRVQYSILEPNPNAKVGNNNLAHLYHQQQSIMNAHNPLQRALRLQQLEAEIARQQAQTVNSAYKVIAEHKDFDLQSTPEVVVRYLELPKEYDDKGYPKKYTAAELKEMKGDNPDLPGYKADFDKLRPGQTVRVTLTKPKADPPKDKDKEKPKGKDVAEDKKPQVARIIILVDAPEESKPAAKPKKNNK
jgi:hypothetical protein